MRLRTHKPRTIIRIHCDTTLSALMKTSSFALDRRLHELLQEEGRTKFTTRSLRDAYAERLEGTSFRLNDVRRYVYEQIRRLVRVGWLVPDEDRRTRGQVFQLLAFPTHLNLELIDNGFENSLRPARTITSQEPKGPGQRALPPDAEERLERKLKEMQLDFLSSMGEAEQYKQLVDEMPQLREILESEYREARDRSSRLLGRLRAVERALKSVAPSR